MKTVVAVIGHVALAVAFLLATTFLLLLHPWTQTQIVRRVAESLETRANLLITLDGVYASPRGVVVLPGLRVTDVDGAPLLSLQEGRIELALGALRRREIRARSILLSGIEVNVSHLADGSLNIAALGAVGDGSRPHPPPETPAAAWSFAVEALDLSGTELTYRTTAPPGRSFTLTEVRVTASDLSWTPETAAVGGAQSGLKGRILELAGTAEIVSTGVEEEAAARELGPIRFEDGAAEIALGPETARVEGFRLMLHDTLLTGSGDASFGADGIAHLREVGIDLSASGTFGFGRVSAQLSPAPGAPPDASVFGGKLGHTAWAELTLRTEQETVLDLRTDLTADQTGERPFYAGLIHLGHGDIYALGVATMPLVAQAELAFFGDFVSVDDFEATIDLRSLHMQSDTEELHLSEMRLVAGAKPDSSFARLDSPFLHAEFSAAQSFLAVPDSVRGHLGRHLSVPAALSSALGRPAEHSHAEGLGGTSLLAEIERISAAGDTAHATAGAMELRIVLHPPPGLLLPLVPALREISSVEVLLSYQPELGSLSMAADVARLSISNWEGDGVQARLVSTPTTLSYSMGAKRLAAGAQEARNLSLSGEATATTFTARAQVSDKEGGTLFAAGARAALEPSADRVTIAFDSEELHLLGWQWHVPAAHRVVVEPTAIHVDQLRFERQDLTITLNSRRAGTDMPAPLDIKISGFELGAVPELVEYLRLAGFPQVGDAGPLHLLTNHDPHAQQIVGVIAATVTVVPFRIQPLLEYASIQAEGLSFQGHTIDSVAATARSVGEDTYLLSATLREGSSRARLSGSYRWSRGELDIALDIVRLELGDLASFLPDRLTDAQGYIRAELTARGPLREPAVGGLLFSHGVSVRIPELGTSFAIDGQAVRVAAADLRRPTLHFDRFTIRDAYGQPLEVNGFVRLAPDLAQTAVETRLSIDRFTAMARAREPGEGFHGVALVDGELTISGSLAEPRISGALSLKSGSAVSFVLPDIADMVPGSSGTVRFVDTPIEAALSEADIPGALPRIEPTLNCALSIDPDTLVEIIVDPRSGDRLRIRGGGDLSLGVDEGGAVSVSGRYTVTEGSYELSFYNLVRREFVVEPGGTIVWTGDPMGARIDITALYSLRTSVAPLFAYAAPVGAPVPRDAVFPFQVRLVMSGDLSWIETRFLIDMPPQERGAMDGAAYAAVVRLNEDESRRNTQAFALIVLNQFVADDLTGLDEVAILHSGARSSASTLLTQQLNALAGRSIPGVDLAFLVESYEYYTDAGTAGRTEIGIELSRPLFQDRLIVRVGGQIDLEGERRREMTLGDIPGDVSAEYLLTPDGRYRLRAFREREYEGLFDRSTTATGLSLGFSREFDRFPWSPAVTPKPAQEHDE